VIVRSSKHLALCAVFGIILPIVCYIADPFVMGGWLSLASLFVFGLSVLTMFAMLTWIVAGGRSTAVDAVVAGVLFVGAGVAALVGILILPFSLIGLFVFIGALGLVPFGTAAVCVSAARRALHPGGALQALGAALAALLLASGYAYAWEAAISKATKAFRLGWDRDDQAHVVEELALWRAFLPEKIIARRTSAELGPVGFERFATRYLEVTGVDLVAIDPLGAGD